jgi:hypothetical protein
MLRGTVTPQFIINGEASAAFVKSNDGESQYVINGGRGTFAWRWDLLADAQIGDNVTFLSTIRFLQDQVPHIDLFALRVSDIASTGINFQAGQIDLPFGNLGEQRFPKENPFYQLPLMNEHVTSLCRSDYRVWTYTPEYAMSGDGVRLLDQGLYDLGMKVYGSIGSEWRIDYGIALINGMPSATGTYSPNGLNPNHSFGKVARIAVTPFTGLTIGVSYAFGPFMRDESDYIAIVDGRPDTSAFYDIAPDNYLQHIVGGDVDFSTGHFSFLGEVIYNSWDYLHSATLKAFSYSAMARYAFTPRFSGAIRAGSITFNNVTNIPEFVAKTNDWYSGPAPRAIIYNGKWDHDVFRLEGATGIRLDESLLLKIGYQWNRTAGLPKDPVDNLLFAQMVLSF